MNEKQAGFALGVIVTAGFGLACYAFKKMFNPVRLSDAQVARVKAEAALELLPREEQAVVWDRRVKDAEEKAAQCREAV